jgi:AraC-like DNA-binding protein
MESNAIEANFAFPFSDPLSLTSSSSTEEDAATVSRIDGLMREQHLYRDPDLTLERLARRAGIPARQISGALNRIYGRNVSQIVNEYRVGDAKWRLIATREPVTVVMLESGFGTKSNFNREFLRVTGMTPSAYRRVGGEPDAALAVQTEASASS